MLEDVFRAEWPRVVASLARRFGDLDIAEEAAGEAVLAALTAWRDRPPPNPGGWLTTTATRKAIDRLRREAQRAGKHAEAVMLQLDPEPVHAVQDDQLRLIATCCHPALAVEARLALTLRLVAGLTVAEIAQGLLSTEAAVGQRITRAKQDQSRAGTAHPAASVGQTPPRHTLDHLPDVQRGLPAGRAESTAGRLVR